MKSSFEGTQGVYLPARLLSRETVRANQNDKEYEQRGVSREQRGVISDPQLADLRRICVSRFEQAAESGSLQSHPRLEEILGWWLGWSRSPDSSQAYFRKLVAIDAGLLVLLEQFLGRRLKEDDDDVLARYVDDTSLSEFEQFMPVDEFKARVEEVSRKPLSEREAKLCALFIRVYSLHLENRAALAAQRAAQPSSAGAVQGQDGAARGQEGEVVSDWDGPTI